MTDYLNRHKIYPAGDHPTTQPEETLKSNARQQYLDGYRDGYNRACGEKAPKPLPGGRETGRKTVVVDVMVLLQSGEKENQK